MRTDPSSDSGPQDGPGRDALDPRLFEAMVAASTDGILAIDGTGRVLFANLAAATLLGRDSASLLGAEFGLPIAAPEPVEVELLSATRGARVAELRVSPGPDGIHVAMLRDVSQRVRLRSELQRLALADQLTGVGNRRAFLALGDQALKLAEREGRACALLFVDIDKMKLINDRFGHRAGDQAVIETARMLTRTVRDSDLVARVGGDEFCVLLTGSSRQVSVQEAIQRVEDAAGSLHESVDFPLSITIGATRFDPLNPKTVGDLMDAADGEMYRVKNRRASSQVVLALGGSALAGVLRGALDDDAKLHMLHNRAALSEATATPGVSLLVIDGAVGDITEIVAAVRQWPGATSMPIAIWHRLADPEAEQEAFDAGADEFLDGRASAGVLRARLARLMA